MGRTGEVLTGASVAGEAVAGATVYGDFDTDPYFSSVAALLHMDGNFTDVTGKTWTAAGSAATDGAIFKFGTGSAHLYPTAPFGGGGAARIITTPDHASLQMGTGDWTIEGWFRPQAPNISHGFWFKKGENTSDGLSFAVSPTLICMRSDGTVDMNATVSLSTSAFTHIAWVRNGSSKKAYVAGIEVASGSAASINHVSNAVLSVGATSGDTRYAYNGHIDDLRITKGVARYTANFTPPTAAFPNS